MKSRKLATSITSYAGTASAEASPGVVERITQWIEQHADVEAVIWTGLPSNWSEKRGCPFSPEDAVNFLLALEAARDRAKAAYDRAREYVTNTPPVVDTVVRKAMRARGWTDVSLSPILIEATPTPASPKPESK